MTERPMWVREDISEVDWLHKTLNEEVKYGNECTQKISELESQVRDLTRDEADRKLVQLARNQELGKLRDDWNAALKRAEKAEAEVRDLTGERDKARMLPWVCVVCWTSSFVPIEDEAECELSHPHEGDHARCDMCRICDTVERLEAARRALPKYIAALDDIYNSGEIGRSLVIKHFGTLHPTVCADIRAESGKLI